MTAEPPSAPPNAAPFADDAECLCALLAWLDLVLRARVAQVRETLGGDPWLRGLHIDDAEVDALLDRGPLRPPWTLPLGDPNLASAIAFTGKMLGERLAASPDASWPALVARFGLEPLEEQSLLLAVAAELDPRYGRLIAWLHDDVTRRRPTVGVALDLFTHGIGERLRGRRAFTPDGRLAGSGLMQLGEGATLDEKILGVAPGVVRWLVGEPALDPEALGVRRIWPEVDETPLGLDGHRARLVADREARRLVAISGPPGSGRQAFARAVARGLERPLYVLDVQRHNRFEDGTRAAFERAVEAALLAARLDDAPLCIRRLDALGGAPEPKDAAEQRLRQGLLIDALARRGPRLAVVTVERPWHPQDPPAGLPPVEQATIEALAVDGRVALWRRALLEGLGGEGAIDASGDAIDASGDAMDASGDAMDASGDAIDASGDAIDASGDAIGASGDAIGASGGAIDASGDAIDSSAMPDPLAGLTEAIEGVADAFRFPPGRIRASAATARGFARAAGRSLPTAPELYRAARAHATPQLGQLAQRVETRYAWADLVLADDRRAQLEEVIVRVRQRTRVLERWGFGDKIVGERGTSALFVGPPGTGKTMAAALIARETKRDLYRIDLSQIVSKYIGETEKHLERTFAEAEATDAALFFDEADALFGKRGEVKDAHDRYANIEVGYLLQRLERFPGLVVLATNLRKNIDEAFLRRMDVIVDFPLPDVQQRTRLWGRIWPDRAPLGDDIDPLDLAERFDLAGGHIRNIALSAAFAAAEDDAAIGLTHVIAAARSEYKKLNKLPDARRFSVERRRR